MRSLVGPVLGLVLLGLVVGAIFGGLLGFVLMPVSYTNTDVANLPAAPKQDWVVMVSAAYVLDGNLDDAWKRINRLDADPAAALRYVADVAQRSIDRSDTRNARNVSALAIALGVGTPAMRNYLQSSPTPVATPK